MIKKVKKLNNKGFLDRPIYLGDYVEKAVVLQQECTRHTYQIYRRKVIGVTKDTGEAGYVTFKRICDTNIFVSCGICDEKGELIWFGRFLDDEKEWIEKWDELEEE